MRKGALKTPAWGNMLTYNILQQLAFLPLCQETLTHPDTNLRPCITPFNKLWATSRRDRKATSVKL